VTAMLIVELLAATPGAVTQTVRNDRHAEVIAGQFTPLGGERDLDLVRDMLAGKEFGDLPGGELPAFISS